MKIGQGGVVEKHVDSAKGPHGEIDESLTLRWFGQIARMQGHHCAARSANRLHGSFSVVGVQIAANNEGVFSREPQGGFATHGSAGACDDAHLFCKSA